MQQVKKAVKNFNLSSKVTLGLVLGAVLLVLDGLANYTGQPLPPVVSRVGQVIVLIIVTLGLVDSANLEKKNILERIKDAIGSAPFIGSIIELVNVALNSLPDLAGILPAGLFNGLHALAAALIALGLRQKIGEARVNITPIDAETLARPKYQAFKE